MSTDTPIPTLTALAGLVEALEAFASWTCPKRFSEPATPASYGDCGKCNWCRARDALAAWRTRVPMAEDVETLARVADVLEHYVVPMRAGDAAPDVLAALDARMGKPAVKPVERCNHCRGNCACPASGAGRFIGVNERVGCIGGTCTCPVRP